MKMAVVQQELCELKMRLEARSGRKISEKDMRLIRKIEQLKEELRELLVELRKRKSEEEHSLILTNVSIYPHPPNTYSHPSPPSPSLPTPHSF